MQQRSVLLNKTARGLPAYYITFGVAKRLSPPTRSHRVKRLRDQGLVIKYSDLVTVHKIVLSLLTFADNRESGHERDSALDPSTTVSINPTSETVQQTQLSSP